MSFIQNVTKFNHKTFGIGVYKGKFTDDSIIVEFSSGIKNISVKAFSMGLISEITQPIPAFSKSVLSYSTSMTISKTPIQYDSSKTHIGGKNILEAFSINNDLLFNESYTIIGDKMEANNIHACYDLTIIGNLYVDEIEVNGSLSVFGDIKAKKIYCQNDLICTGEIQSSSLEVGGDLIAKTARCKNLFCGKNAIIKTSIDIEETRIEKILIAGEGIYGEGNLSVQNAIAVEYFEYNGEIEGQIFELDTNKTFGSERVVQTEHQEITLNTIIDKLPKIISSEIIRHGETGESDILEFISKINDCFMSNYSDWFEVFCHVIDISYLDTIDNFRDYLFLLYAKEILPSEILNYETVEHIFGTPFEEAMKKSKAMTFSSNTISEFIMSLKIISKYGNKLSIDEDEAFDKVFQSVGIKYSTVKKYLTK